MTNAVLQVNGYMRQMTSGFKNRRFQIYIELQAAPNQIQTRSYSDNYTIVVTPSPDTRTFDIRHAYLHYLLDPLATRNQEILNRKKSLVDHAMRAQALSDAYKEDYLLLVTESLIKAVESRLDRKPGMIQEALNEGYILAPYFAEALPVYEKQESSMYLYYTEMMQAIDLVKEDQRLTGVEFSKSSAARPAVKTPAPAPPPALTGAAKTLEEAEQAYSSRELEKSKKLFLKTLEQTEKRSVHASAYYGLARIALLRKGSGRGGTAIPEVAGIGAGGFRQGMGSGVSGTAVGSGRRPRQSDGVFPKRSSIGRCDRKGAPGSEAGPGTDEEKAVKEPEGVLRMKRMILTGLLAIGAGATCLLAQGAPKGPAPKSKGELEALQALQAAGNDPDKAIAASENLITKFADTDFKAVALYIEADAYQRKGDFDHMVIFAERALEADPKDFRAMIMLANHYATHTRENDLDREEKLGKSEKYANQVIDLMKTATKPNPQITGRAVGGHQEGRDGGSLQRHRPGEPDAQEVRCGCGVVQERGGGQFASRTGVHGAPGIGAAVGRKERRSDCVVRQGDGHGRRAPADQERGHAGSRSRRKGRRQGARRRGQVISPYMRAEPAILELKLKYRFTNQELLRRALTHSSLACETRNGAGAA